MEQPIPTTEADLARVLIEGQAQEGSRLEFKRAASLARDNKAKTELVKDITGFANAGGGRIYYGIAEDKATGIAVASGIDPVADPVYSKEWISQVVRDSTSPPLSDIDIHEIPVMGGRVMVVDVERAHTAHQNLLDHVYYGRSGVTTRALDDSQIRDVMGRRTAARVEVKVVTRHVVQQPALHGHPALHRYDLALQITNVGHVTVEDWLLDVRLPAMVIRDSRYRQHDVMRASQAFHRVVRERIRGSMDSVVTVGDPDWTGQRHILHPGRDLIFSPNENNFPSVLVEVDDDIWSQLKSTEPPIIWTLYLKDQPPIEGSVPFDEWCRF